MLKILLGISLFYIYICGIKFLKYDEYIINRSSPALGKLLNTVMKISGIDSLYTTFVRNGKLGKEKQLNQIEKDLVNTTEKLRDIQLNIFSEEEGVTEEDFTIVVKDTIRPVFI